jgi:hypothetical protein
MPRLCTEPLRRIRKGLLAGTLKDRRPLRQYHSEQVPKLDSRQSRFSDSRLGRRPRPAVTTEEAVRLYRALPKGKLLVLPSTGTLPVRWDDAFFAGVMEFFRSVC